MERSEHRIDSLTTAVALQLLSLGTIWQGKNETSFKYLTEGLRMGERMELFGAQASNSVEADPATTPTRESKAITRTAWGIFNWLV